MPSSTHRRRAREIAMQVLFQQEFLGETDLKTSLAYFRETVDASEDSWSYAEKLLKGIAEHKTAIDSAITEKSRNWKIQRMAPVDLCVLRIGAYELSFGGGEVPPKVVIDEAIEIAKRFGGTESPQFVNGILDEIHRMQGV